VKVLLVTTEFGNGNSGGVESVTKFVHSAIARLRDWDVEIASLRMSRHAPESQRMFDARSWTNRNRVTSQSLDGVVVHNIGCAWSEIEWNRFQPRRWLDALLRDVDIVVVIAGTPAVCNAVTRAKVPIVLQVATLVKLERKVANSRLRGPMRYFRSVTTWATSRLDERGLARADRVLVENRRMFDECTRRNVHDTILCAPGVDTDYFHPATHPPGRPYLLMTGRLGDARKNVSGLLHAYATARENYGLTHDLILAGLSAPSSEDMALIRSLNLDGFIRVQSPVSKEQLLRLYQGADLFVSTSFEEGLGLTYIEAMACGVPIVVTNTDGADFVLGHSTAGAAVVLGDRFTDRYARELARWCSDSKLRLDAKQEARQRAVQYFSASSAAEKFVTAIEKATVRIDEGRAR
jgi:glycosyltransferase involved in cell wall biosynthesis